MRIIAAAVLVLAVGTFLLTKFGWMCKHKNMCFPITRKLGDRSNLASQLTGTYVVCLDCGSEFPYDWREMRIVSRREMKNARNSLIVTNS